MTMKAITLGYERNAAPRVEYGIQRLREALQNSGYTVLEAESEATWSLENYRSVQGLKIYIGNRQESAFVQQLEQRDVLLYHTEAPEGEGFI